MMASAGASPLMIDASKPMKIACINDIHLNPSYSEDFAHFKEYNMSTFGGAEQEEAWKKELTILVAMIKKQASGILSFWNWANDKSGLSDAEIQTMLDYNSLYMFQSLKLTVESVFSSIENDIGFPIDKAEVMMDKFWKSTMQSICYFKLAGGNCNLDLGIYGEDAPEKLFYYVLKTLFENEFNGD